MEKYTHRNGETEPPTVDGWYWVDNLLPVPFRQGMLLVSGYGDEDDEDLGAYAYDFQEEQFTFDDLAGIHWWGPVTPPWEQSDAN